jgi:cobalamin-dependent methionine synthase I
MTPAEGVRDPLSRRTHFDFHGKAGVQFAEDMMMDPEASVSTLVFHHPDCTYFSVGEIPKP